MRIGASWLAAVGLCCLFSSSPAQATPVPIRLLPIGDSITELGYYFDPLLSKLSAGGYAPSIIANEGHSGYVIDGATVEAPRAGLLENIGRGRDFLNHPGVNSPDTYILLMIGTNDVNVDVQLSTAAVQNRMRDLITAIRKEAPLAHLIGADIVPQLATPDKDAAARKFNSDIDAVFRELNMASVDMYKAFDAYPGFDHSTASNVLMYDRLHPNRLGGEVMADASLKGIQGMQPVAIAMAVPEPSTWAMCLTALCCLPFFLRRRAR